MSHSPAQMPLHWALTKGCVHAELSQVTAGSCFPPSVWRTPRDPGLCIHLALASLGTDVCCKHQEALGCCKGFLAERIPSPAVLPMGTFPVLELCWQERSKNPKRSLREAQVRKALHQQLEFGGSHSQAPGETPCSNTWGNVQAKKNTSCMFWWRSAAWVLQLCALPKPSLGAAKWLCMQSNFWFFFPFLCHPVDSLWSRRLLHTPLALGCRGSEAHAADSPTQTLRSLIGSRLFITKKPFKTPEINHLPGCL